MIIDKQYAQKAVVIGCGIAGPVVAMALQKAGIDAVVYEAQTKSADDVGLFLNVASNGLSVLRTLGADAEVRARAFPTPRMVMWSGSGKRLGEVQNGPALASGIVSMTIRRGQLHGALRDEARRRGIRIESGKRLVDVESASHGIVARFADGSEAPAGLLIGVDGLHSRTRQLIDAQAPAPRFTGQLSVGGIARNHGLSPTPDCYHMIFGRRGFFGYSITPAGDAYWFANLQAEDPSRETLASISSEAWRARLDTLFSDDAGPARTLLDATTDELGAYPIYDMPRVPCWHRDRMVLVGDAAHATSPSSGQGAALAIEDAFVLARCLRDTPEPTTAFVRYEQLRRQRVERVVRESARVSNSKVPGPVGRFFRDLMMPTALKLFASPSGQAWLYDHPLAWNDETEAQQDAGKKLA